MNLPTTTPNDRDLAWYVRECEWLDDRNRVLERENAALREELAEVKKAFSPTFVRELHAECINLKRENAALRADKERLDWLSSQKDQPWLYWERPLRLTREAIDAFRKEAQP